MKRNTPPLIRLAAAMLGLGIAQADARPLASEDLQRPVPPKPLTADPAALPAPLPSPTAQAVDQGPSVELSGVEIEGNQRVSSETLLQRLGAVAGTRYTLAGMNELAARLAAAYRELGYPFVRAFIPPQKVEQGVLRIRIIEGVLGDAQVHSTDSRAGGAQAFVDAGLPLGDVIRDHELERTMLLLDDQPGFKVHPVMAPGTRSGESALQIEVVRKSDMAGEVGLDNTGSEATGRNRLHGSISLNSPWRFGDRISASAMVTDKHLWLGSADYEAPLNATGLRGQLGYSRTSYQLGNEFSALGASGTAKTATIKLSYPLLRSQRANAVASLALQHKALDDRFETLGLVKTKFSNLATMALQFDRKDSVGGGGVTYGLVGLTTGELRLDDASRPLDDATARTNGHFARLNLDITRIQKLPGVFSAYARFSGQRASGNLDSSEKYGIGGFLGVRTYPMGEGNGDNAWLTQLELRADAGGGSVFAFADAGQAWTNAKPWDGASSQRRTIAGAGVGARWLSGGWSLESTLGRRAHGGPPQSETRDRSLVLFASLTYRFER